MVVTDIVGGAGRGSARGPSADRRRRCAAPDDAARLQGRPRSRERLRDVGLVRVEAQRLAERLGGARAVAQLQAGQAEAVQGHGRPRSRGERPLEVGHGLGGAAARGRGRPPGRGGPRRSSGSRSTALREERDRLVARGPARILHHAQLRQRRRRRPGPPRGSARSGGRRLGASPSSSARSPSPRRASMWSGTRASTCS